MKNTPLRYRLLLIGMAPLISAGLLHQAFVKHKGDRSVRGERRRFLSQRLGLSSYRTNAAAPVWLHAASVGEVNAALALLDILLERYPALTVLITTNTITGAQTVRQKLTGHHARIEHRYLPVDFPWSVRRFLATARPRSALIMETELWPNLYRACRERGIGVCLINARLSKKTLNMPVWFRPVLHYCLKQVDAILARGESDARHFIDLGAETSIVKTTGNIKFAGAQNTAASDAPGPLPRPYVLAASTHDGEERLLAGAWQSLLTNDTLLVIAPRYPQRRDAIESQLKPFGLKVASRSRGDPVSDDTDVYLVDTLGELQAFMPDATLVFMGGSLVPRGGQNVFEPARLGKAIVTGPHTFTYEAEIQALREAGAIVCVNDVDALTESLKQLLSDPARAKRLGDNARRLCERNAGVAETYAAELERLGFMK